jgi:hypothetical protein
MLPHQTLTAKLRAKGRADGYRGVDDCQWKHPDLSSVYWAGWKLGWRERSEDLNDGRHPELQGNGTVDDVPKVPVGPAVRRESSL